ncbi:hypothetical protein ES332_D12G260300v1 [Gossypium tomentosum]|uniref:B box-type domain-containing protein n=1 Tax=Gossypium tomentosum TaxID=34277 RepID=A0A5D2IDH7_GOSTO|nr:hypothetical protein ES332_D12G260300v1 [Gossypium tomentosum]
MVGPRSIPHWLGVLLGQKFFDPCILHESAKKNEKNIFCLNCCITICPHCLPLHRHHRRLQPYTTNSAKVIFLNERPMSRPFRGSGNLCVKCDRSLQDPFLFCSLSCKVKHLLYKSRNDFWLVEQEVDPQMTPDSVLDFHRSSWSGGSANTAATSNGDSGTNCKPSSLLCTATTEFLKINKKKRSCILTPRVPHRHRCSQAESNSRRKGVPHRSPLN